MKAEVSKEWARDVLLPLNDVGTKSLCRNWLGLPALQSFGNGEITYRKQRMTCNLRQGSHGITGTRPGALLPG